jgi:hypothetical protein
MRDVKPLLKALLLYLVMLTALWPSLREERADEQALPALPVEATIVGGGEFCRSELLLRSLGARAFRWARREGERAPLWAHGLTVLCDESAGESVKIAVLAGKTAVFKTTYRRDAGFDGDNVTARVIARLLPLEPAVQEAALDAYLRNQTDVARAGADLWRAGRWQEAQRTLSLALENNWPERDQADLYFGLADAEAHLGRPRQAFWHALAYMGVSGKEPPQAWFSSLRGAAGAAAGTSGAEPKAQELARRWTQAASARRWDAALETLKALSDEAPWSDRYQTTVAVLYAKLGWTPLAESWTRRAALTRRLSADADLQRRLALELR